MEKEVEQEINYWLAKLILMKTEINYKVNSRGEIIFKDKQSVIGELKGIISNFAAERNLDMKDVNEHLRNIYDSKRKEKDQEIFQEEYKEVINILCDIETKEER